MRPFNRTTREVRGEAADDPVVPTGHADGHAPAPGPGDGAAPGSGSVDAPELSTRSLLVQTFPVALAVGAYGLSYGVLAVAAGLSPGLATLSSLLVLAGGSQFAFVGVLAGGGNPMAGAIGGLLLNVRYLAFGLAIARALPGGPWWRRGLDSYLIVDESVALALGSAGPESAHPDPTRWRTDVVRRFRVMGWGVVIAWISATAVGSYGGQLIGDPEVLGLDAAFPAGFLALLAPWLRSRAGKVAAVLGVVLALALTPVTPPGVPIIAAALGGVLALRVPQPAGSLAVTSPATDVAASAGPHEQERP